LCDWWKPEHQQRHAGGNTEHQDNSVFTREQVASVPLNTVLQLLHCADRVCLSEVEGNVRATRFVVIKSIGMTVSVKSFAKINLGLRIGSQRADGFHELRTVYQTIALNDIVRVSVRRGSGIEIRCDDPRVPHDSSNTCWRIVDVAMRTMKARGRVIIEIEKRLPVQGGLGGASGNAVAALIALERALQKQISGPERLRIAAEVGSDLPLFLVGGTVLGVGRGEEVYPLPDLAAMACVIALPEIAVSTPKAFAEWDRLIASRMSEKQVARLRSLFASEQVSLLGMTHAGGKRDNAAIGKLTVPAHSDRMLEFGREISAWLNAGPVAGKPRRSGVSARSGGRAENPLLDLVRTGIENDFEKVVFPKRPELHEVKRVLERAGAKYASLSGSGSAVYGLFDSKARADNAAKKLNKSGTRAVVTSTLTRRQYWKRLQISD
jgi:4-diphosphocytidyl-2-C-methyl-D-erythritol kinase